MQTRLSYQEALAIVREQARRLDSESLPLAAAGGRIAAADLAAPFALPGFANSAMDGYAVRGSDLPASGERAFRRIATVLAGETAATALAAGETAAVMTGALLPAGADTVVIQEQARIDGESIWLPAGTMVGANVRAADDDCAEAAAVLAAGDLLTPARLALLAAFGLDQVQVVRRPRIAVLVTGNELLPAGADRLPGQRYDSNGRLLAGLIQTSGGELIESMRVGDDPAALRAALARLSERADLVLSSGGASVGAADYLPAVLTELGEVLFWKVRMKPGMPVLCARLGAALMFALPGNPVSVGVSFQVLVRPLLDAMLGRSDGHGLTGAARLTTAWRKAHPRLEFLRVRLSLDGQGGLHATPLAHQGSGALSVLAQADALALLPEGEHDYAVGDLVEVQGCAPPWAA